jgi:1-acyl-sn-glycerol-3-phosphate acyltransferase
MEYEVRGFRLIYYRRSVISLAPIHLNVLISLEELCFTPIGNNMCFVYRFIITVFRVFFAVFYRNKIVWEVDPKTIPGAAIIAPNHTSYLDPPLVAGSWWKPLHFFAGGHLFEKRWLRWFLFHLNSHPVVKGQELASVRTALQLLREGKKIVVFPEGTRSKDGKMQQLQNGVAFLASQTGSPIIPCFIKGTYGAWPRKCRWPKLFSHRTTCIFGRPIPSRTPDGNFIPKAQLSQSIEQELKRLSNI